ncbi:SusD family protein [bacterium A37T11]|nr:SusD family protein [bacterium A37T11]
MKFLNIFSILLIVILTNSCSKEFLDAKPSSNIVVPQTLDDIQNLLDNEFVLNQTPALEHVASDEYYSRDYTTYQTLRVVERNAYVWANDVYQGASVVPDWDIMFTQIYYANVALEQLDKITRNSGNNNKFQALEGAAYFIRAYAYFHLAQTFCLPYDSLESKSDLGLPLRVQSGVDNVQQRATVEQTYNQIIADLSLASRYLEVNTIPGYNKNRPSQCAAFALLSKVYLNMHNYPSSLLYSDSALMRCHDLIDYNDLDTTDISPFSVYGTQNPEIVYRTVFILGYRSTSYNSSTTILDSTLYSMYLEHDLRRSIFFKRSPQNLPILKCLYQADGFPMFTGLAVDEIMLDNAECLSRLGKLSKAKDVLNTLLIKRFVTSYYTTYSSTNQQEVLNTILAERRKELTSRGIRWMDIRRLNREGSNIVLQRNVNGEMISLLPNSKKYAFPIPDYEISISKIAQNP